MVEASGTPTPQPSSAAQSSPVSDESTPEESNFQRPPPSSHELGLKEGDKELSVAETLATMSETDPLKQVVSETEPPKLVLGTELLKPAVSGTEPMQLAELETERPQQTPEVEQPHKVATNPRTSEEATSETESKEAMLETKLVPPEKAEAERLVPPENAMTEAEPQQQEPDSQQKAATEPARSHGIDVLDWTEPEPPEAAVIEAAEAAESETEPPKPSKTEKEHKILGESKTEPEEAKTKPLEPSTMEAEHKILKESNAEPETHKPEPVEPEPVEPVIPAAVASRSLAEMMSGEEAEEEKPEKPKTQIPRSLGSFKEESNRISDLSTSELDSLHELRRLLQESTSACEGPEEISIWGIPLLKDDRSDVVLLKFLRARDFKTQEAYTMLRETLQWRKEFNIEELVDENLGDDLDKVVFMQGHDREGHPVCYNVYGEFRNKDLYQKTFSDEEKRNRFLRWRIQFLEKSIRKLDLSSSGVSTICQVNDLKNSPGPGMKDLRLATKQAVQLLQDNYPEFVSKQIFINVPWWYLAFYKLISPFMTQRSKSKLVFSSPSRSSETLFKYISPEQVPIQYGGLSSVNGCHCDSEFTADDAAIEITIRPSMKQNVEIIIYEKCRIVWEIRVVGWEVTYGAEFVPDNKEAYTVVPQKPRKMSGTEDDEAVVSQSFQVRQPGKLLFSIDNPTSKKKKLLYRFKVQPLCD